MCFSLFCFLLLQNSSISHFPFLFLSFTSSFSPPLPLFPGSRYTFLANFSQSHPRFLLLCSLQLPLSPVNSPPRFLFLSVRLESARILVTQITVSRATLAPRCAVSRATHSRELELPCSNLRPRRTVVFNARRSALGECYSRLFAHPSPFHPFLSPPRPPSLSARYCSL